MVLLRKAQKVDDFMKKFPVALQLYSVRDNMAEDFEGTLKKVKELGFDGVEFAGLFDKTPAEVKELVNKIGLTPISAHVPFADMVNDTENVLSGYAEIGCKYVVVPYMTEEYRPGAEKFDELIEGIKKIGTKARELCMTLLYHNHDFEFVKIGDEYGLDVLYASVDEEIFKTELDTCWVNVGGENPAEYILKYTGRSPVVHLKDFVINGEQKGSLYKLIGIDDEEASDNTEEGFAFRPVGYGCQDFKAILEASDKAGAEWVVVEQDEATMGKTPIESAEMSRNYLKDNFGI